MRRLRQHRRDAARRRRPARLLYQQALSQASDLIERGFLERMVAEERSHFAVLTDMKSYLSDPASSFAEKERSSYDGA